MRLIDADSMKADLLTVDPRYEGMIQWCITVLDAQPTIKRKTGEWIMGKCDQCGAHAPFWPMATTYYESDFCPNCGADMRGEENG